MLCTVLHQQQSQFITFQPFLIFLLKNKAVPNIWAKSEPNTAYLVGWGVIFSWINPDEKCWDGRLVSASSALPSLRSVCVWLALLKETVMAAMWPKTSSCRLHFSPSYFCLPEMVSVGVHQDQGNGFFSGLYSIRKEEIKQCFSMKFQCKIHSSFKFPQCSCKRPNLAFQKAQTWKTEHVIIYWHVGTFTFKSIT